MGVCIYNLSNKKVCIYMCIYNNKMYVCVCIYIYIYIYVCGGYLDKFISAATGSPQTKIPSSAPV